MDLLVVSWIGSVTQTDPGVLFGWIESVFTRLGVWGYVQAFVALAVIIGGVQVFQRIFNR